MVCDLDERTLSHDDCNREDAGPKTSHGMRRVSASSTVLETTRCQLLRSTTASEAADSRRSGKQSNGDDISRATALTIATSCPKEGADATDSADGGAGEDDEVQSVQSLPFKTLALAQLYQCSRRSRNSTIVRTSSKRECVGSDKIHPLPFLSNDVRQPRPADSSRESNAATPAQTETGYDETLNESRLKTHRQQHDMSPEWAFDFVPVHRHSLHSDAASISSMESLSMDFFDQPDEVTESRPSAKRRKCDNIPSE